MRVGFKTTLETNLISEIKIKAIQEGVDVNDILEILIEKYLNGDIEINLEK